MTWTGTLRWCVVLVALVACGDDTTAAGGSGGQANGGGGASAGGEAPGGGGPDGGAGGEAEGGSGGGGSKGIGEPCSSDAECADACDDDLGVCAEPEQCLNGIDDDGDGLHDCAELDCAEDPGCGAGIETACGGAVVLADGVPVSGDTTGGTDFFAGDCAGAIGGGEERLYAFTAPADGVLLLEASAESGDLGLYVRGECAAAATQLACADAEIADGAREHLALEVTRGEALSIFVDAHAAGDEGPFELVADFQPLVCGDGAIVGAEQCDDGGTASGDGCGATCAIEPVNHCASNAVGVLTSLSAANGDTSTGTNGFTGSCGGAGREQLFRFTPVLSGNATFTLSTSSADADLVLYARATCAESGSELGCRDLAPAGGAETLTLPVVGGTPVVVFVDSLDGWSSGAFSLSVSVQ